MVVSLSCKKCKANLKVPEQYAGKKIKCPKCTATVAVPAGTEDEEEFVAVEVMPDERIKQGPPRKTKPSRSREDEDEDDDRDRDLRRSTRIRTDRDREDRDDRDDRRSSRFREEDERDRQRRRKRYLEEEEEYDRRNPKRGTYKRCPSCGASGAKRVLWTAWGSFYGPAMFTHVRCPECGYCYNGRTGRSNTLAATIFVSVPLIGILAILGAIIYMLMLRGHL